jgi:hypothetical protein
MSFKFFKNGKEISAPRRISWRFSGYSQVFESAPEKLDVNRSFWRRKLGIPEGTGIQILADGFEIEQENNATAIPLPTDHTPDIAIDNGPDLESSVPQTSEDTVDTPKRKYNRKTTELPSMSSELDNTDSSTDE